MANPLIVYGAYGYTGELVARRAAERGLSPVLAGRDSERLVRLARELGCEWRAFPLTDADAARRGIRGAAAVIHCAGPFVRTFRPMAEACVEEKVHYLDITGEVPVFEALVAMDAPARAAGITLLPGAGFDIVPSDCLAAHLAAKLPGARSLVLALGGLDRPSRGTARTMLEHAGAARSRPGGGPAQRTFDLGRGPVTCVAVPWADGFTAPRSTGIPEVTVYLAAGLPTRAILKVAPHLSALLSSRTVREILASFLTSGEAGPGPEDRSLRRSAVLGEVTDAAGKRAAALLRLPHPYVLTALAAVEIAERVLKGDAKPGWQTPSTAYGPGLVLALPGVVREEL